MFKIASILLSVFLLGGGSLAAHNVISNNAVDTSLNTQTEVSAGAQTDTQTTNLGAQIEASSNVNSTVELEATPGVTIDGFLQIIN